MLVVLSDMLMLLDLFVAVVKVTVSVAIMQLEVPATLMQAKVSTVNVWMTIFIEIMQVGVSVGIMQVVFSAVHHAHDYFILYYILYIILYSMSIVVMQVAVSVVAMYVTASSSNFIFLSLTEILFHKIDQKTFKGIISSLHFTTLVNILPKYFVGRIYIQIG